MSENISVMWIKQQLLKQSCWCSGCTNLYVVVLIKDELVCDSCSTAVRLCVRTFNVWLFQSFKLLVISKYSMKAPVTSLT